MTDAMKCPTCNSEHAYQDRGLWVCPECGHEWSGTAEAVADAAQEAGVRDANGNALADGDSVIVMKDLKVKGSSLRGQGWHQGPQHPPAGRYRRPQHRLQDRRHRRDEPEIGVREEGVAEAPDSPGQIRQRARRTAGAGADLPRRQVYHHRMVSAVWRLRSIAVSAPDRIRTAPSPIPPSAIVSAARRAGANR